MADVARDYDFQRGTGYVTSMLPAGQWARGEMPEFHYGATGFGLPRPQVMREPGTNLAQLRLADQTVTVNLDR